jgi:hypothetical protein
MKIHNTLDISVDENHSPIKTKSKYLCENLNAQLLNGKESTDFLIKKVFKVGDGSSSNFKIIHNLEYDGVIILIYNNSTHSILNSGYKVSIEDENSINVNFLENIPDYLEYSCIIIK